MRQWKDVQHGTGTMPTILSLQSTNATVLTHTSWRAESGELWDSMSEGAGQIILCMRYFPRTETGIVSKRQGTRHRRWLSMNLLTGKHSQPVPQVQVVGRTVLKLEGRQCADCCETWEEVDGDCKIEKTVWGFGCSAVCLTGVVSSSWM